MQVETVCIPEIAGSPLETTNIVEFNDVPHSMSYLYSGEYTNPRSPEDHFTNPRTLITATEQPNVLLVLSPRPIEDAPIGVLRIVDDTILYSVDNTPIKLSQEIEEKVKALIQQAHKEQEQYLISLEDTYRRDAVASEDSLSSTGQSFNVILPSSIESSVKLIEPIDIATTAPHSIITPPEQHIRVITPELETFESSLNIDSFQHTSDDWLL